MSRTAKALIRELAQRMGEYFLFSATGTGTTTSIVSTQLDQFFPKSISGPMGHWIYCSAGTNVGQEVRAWMYNTTGKTWTLNQPGFTGAPVATDEFEVHARTRRARKLEALNDAIGQLGLLWFREFYDTSLITQQNVWNYTLPSSQNWSNISQVEIQTTTNAILPTYPYLSADPYDWRIRRDVNQTTGAETFVIQFGIQPPIGRILRIHGEGYFSDLAADTDVLAGVGGKWERAALGWIFDWAKYRVLDEEIEGMPSGDVMKYRQRAQDKLIEARDRIIQLLQTHEPGKIIVPGHGTAQLGALDPQSDWRYFGAFGGSH